MHPLLLSVRPLAAAALTALISVGLSGQALALEITSGKQAVIYKDGAPTPAAGPIERYGTIASGQRDSAELMVSENSTMSLLATGNVWSQGSRTGLSNFASASVFMNTYDGERSAYVEVTSSISLTDTFIITCPTCVNGTVAWAGLALGGNMGQYVSTGGFAFNSPPDGAYETTALYYSTSNGASSTGVPPPPWGEPRQDQAGSSYAMYDIQSNGNHSAWDIRDDGAVMFQFVYGEPITFGLHLTTRLTAEVRSGTTGQTDAWALAMSNQIDSITFGGVYVTDFDNNPVRNISALSADGYNYALAAAVVPEPGTWALMAGGLALLGAFARRRRA